MIRSHQILFVIFVFSLIVTSTFVSIFLKYVNSVLIAYVISIKLGVTYLSGTCCTRSATVFTITTSILTYTLTSCYVSIYLNPSFLTYRAPSTLQPPYLASLLHLSNISRELSSSISQQLIAPKIKSYIGQLCFICRCAQGLERTPHSPTISETIAIFRKQHI